MGNIGNRQRHAAHRPCELSTAAGVWRAGDQVLNREPKAGGYVGWVCVAAGSPGEWRPFGPIA